MTENKDNIEFKDCKYVEKYDKMGVTPRELFCRQNKICYLTLVYDKYDGEEHYGDIYCTDGTEYAITSSMLNPTYECAKCITSFMKKTLEQVEMNNKLDKTIVGILIKIGESKARQEGDTELSMRKETFDFIEEHLDNTTMFSNETNPLKITASGNIMLFGAKVNFVSEIEEGSIMIEPGSLTYQV